MFNRDRNEKEDILAGMGDGRHETVIGPSVKVDGDFAGEGNVLVQGVVNGTLKTKGNLRVVFVEALSAVSLSDDPVLQRTTILLLSAYIPDAIPSEECGNCLAACLQEHQ